MAHPFAEMQKSFRIAPGKTGQFFSLRMSVFQG